MQIATYDRRVRCRLFCEVTDAGIRNKRQGIGRSQFKNTSGIQKAMSRRYMELKNYTQDEILTYLRSTLLTKDQKLERGRIKKEILDQPRDWKGYWKCYASHMIQGGVAGALSVVSVFKSSFELSVFAFTITTMYIGYQGLSFARKHDTVGRDLADYGIGWSLGAFLLYLIDKI